MIFGKKDIDAKNKEAELSPEIFANALHFVSEVDSVKIVGYEDSGQNGVSDGCSTSWRGKYGKTAAATFT